MKTCYPSRQTMGPLSVASADAVEKLSEPSYVFKMLNVCTYEGYDIKAEIEVVAMVLAIRQCHSAERAHFFVANAVGGMPKGGCAAAFNFDKDQFMLLGIKSYDIDFVVVKARISLENCVTTFSEKQTS